MNDLERYEFGSLISINIIVMKKYLVQANGAEVSILYHSLDDLIPNLLEGEYKESCKALKEKLWQKIVQIDKEA